VTWISLAACTAVLILLALALPGAASAYAPELTRYPYLTDVVGASAAVNWATDRSRTNGRIRYGEAGTESCTAHAVTASRSSITINGQRRYQWRADLTGLRPGARYCYRVELGAASPVIDLLGSDPSPSFQAQVPEGSPEPFSFAVFGDWGAAGVDQGGTDNRQAQLMSRIAASGVRFALGTGDTAYPGGSQTNYGDLIQTGTNVSAVFSPLGWTQVGSTIPMFNALGNHGFNNTHLAVWPQSEAAASSGGRYVMDTYCCANGTRSASYPSGWYAFDAGNARFYVLEAAWANSNVGTADVYKNDYDAHWRPDSAQYRWLENDLRTHRSQLKFAVFHYPMYSSNASEESDPYLRGPDSLEGLLARYGVDIGFSGHAHNYTRNVKPHANSLVTYVTGGGGARLQPATRCGAPVAYAIGWSYTSGGTSCGGAPRPTSVAQVFHFLKVSVNGSRVTVTPTDSQGRTFDVQTYNFGGSPPPPPPPPPPGNIGLVGQSVAGTPVAASSLGVPITSSTGNALVATIAVQAGTTTSVTSVSDSAGNTWTKGPVGLLAGSNTRVEIWYSTGAAPVAGVTVNLSAADLASANVSEWRGVAASGALDASAGQGNASATTAPTPSITTSTPGDLVIGGINFPRTAESFLATDFTQLRDFSAGTVSGRAAYRIAPAAGAHSITWNLSAASPSGGAILALKAGAP
jgi:Calcineurin-like phosphoesterase/Purple acid Phosphatase, N-terminal domain